MKELEFDEMRAQIALLKSKIEKEEIVNDRLLLEVMNTKVRTIRTQALKHVGVGILAMVVMPTLHFIAGVSWTFIAATMVMLVFCIGATIYFHQPINSRSFIEDDVKTLAEKAARLKKQYQTWLHYVTPTLIIPWLGLYCYEVAKGMDITGEALYAMIIVICVGCFIGLLIGYSMHKKVVDSCDDIIRQIEE